METESDLKPWQCKFCTFMNKSTWLVCGMCLKECKAFNNNDYLLDFRNMDTDDLPELDTASDYPLQPIVAMVSAAATTNASRNCIPPIPAGSVVSTNTSVLTTIPTASIATSGYVNAGNAAGNNSHPGVTAYFGATSTPFNPASSLNKASSITNNATTKKYAPYIVVPANITATLVNGQAVNNRHSAKTHNIPIHSDVPRLRVITPKSNPSYFVSSSATKVTSTNTLVPSTITYNSSFNGGGFPIPLLKQTEPLHTFRMCNGDNVVTPVTPLITIPVSNGNSYSCNAGAQIAQPNFSVASSNSRNFTVTPNLPNNNGSSHTGYSNANITQNDADTQLPVLPRSARSTAPVVSSLIAFQCGPVTQMLPISRVGISNSSYTIPKNTVAVSSATIVSNPPFVPGVPTFNGAARVTTAAFAIDAARGWMCSYCSFMNDKLLRRCAVCDTEEPQIKKKERPAQVLSPPVATNNNTYVANDVYFECPSCYLLFALSEGMILENCGHQFCKNCLREVICYSEDVQLKCSFKTRGVFCNNLLTDQEIVSILNFSVDDANVTIRPAQQNVVARPSQQNGISGSSQRNDVLSWFSRQNLADVEVINLCSDKEVTRNHIENLPIDAERNPTEVVGNKLNYQELLNLEKEILIPNVENFDCTICMTEQSPGEGVVIRDCLHMFCRECLKQAIKCNTDAEMRCPFGDGTTRCESLLQDREIKALVDANDFEKHLSRSIKEAEGKIQNTFHCKTVDCVGWCEYEEKVTEFNCPVCFKTNCINCQAIHTELNCQQYQVKVQMNSANNPEDAKTNKMLQSMLKKGIAMNCPKCAIILSKVTGCDWLCCSMCKTEICWITRGPRWGPKGRGDTSGGCRCRFQNGKLCHPRCSNCH